MTGPQRHEVTESENAGFSVFPCLRGYVGEL
jgi:hypothetical protein